MAGIRRTTPRSLAPAPARSCRSDPEPNVNPASNSSESPAERWASGRRDRRGQNRVVTVATSGGGDATRPRRRPAPTAVNDLEWYSSGISTYGWPVYATA